MVELIVNGNQIELPKNTNIKYTKQISDIFDIANVSCSFTNAFEFEKTPNNSQAMKQLGISGDSSDVPYTKNDAILKVNGFDLISKGWFNIQNTSDNYKGAIIDGMIDFFKSIENKTMGNDLDLSNFNHDKILQVVIDSFTNEYYQYIVADYGGKNLFEGGINIDYLAPGFSVRKLCELIFSTFNFNVDFTNLEYIDGLFITYPKDVYETQSNELIVELGKDFYSSFEINRVAGVAQPTQFYFWDSSVITEGDLVDNWKFIIPETNSYNFDLRIAMYVVYRRYAGVGPFTQNIDPEVTIFKNGVAAGALISSFTVYPEVGDERFLNFNMTCNKGDTIEVRIGAPDNIINQRRYKIWQWRHGSTYFRISKTNLGTVILENELKDFLIKDFFKEILWRTGITPVYDKYTNTVSFKTLDSRVDFNNAQDLSHCYKERRDEIYKNDYAQKNIFKLKRDVDSETAGDGYLYVYNKNIDDEKTLAQSKIYAPDNKILTEFIDFQTNQYKIWQIEVKDNNDDVEINYKGLSGRFYFIRKQTATGSFKIISEKLNDEQIVGEVPYAINTNTLFEESIYNNYTEYQRIFTNFRIHPITMVMTENDFLGLDMTRPVFFKQENAFYICNKVSFEEGKENEGEFIKINKV